MSISVLASASTPRRRTTRALLGRRPCTAPSTTAPPRIRVYRRRHRQPTRALADVSQGARGQTVKRSRAHRPAGRRRCGRGRPADRAWAPSRSAHWRRTTTAGSAYADPEGNEFDLVATDDPPTRHNPSRQSQEATAMTDTEQRNKALVLEAFDTLVQQAGLRCSGTILVTATTFSTARTSNRAVRACSHLSKPHRPTCATRTC